MIECKNHDFMVRNGRWECLICDIPYKQWMEDQQAQQRADAARAIDIDKARAEVVRAAKEYRAEQIRYDGDHDICDDFLMACGLEDMREAFFAAVDALVKLEEEKR